MRSSVSVLPPDAWLLFTLHAASPLSTLIASAAPTLWRLGAEAIAGITRVDGAMRIDPCIPPRWDGIEAWIRLGAYELHEV